MLELSRSAVDMIQHTLSHPVQVVGRKYIRLYPASMSEDLYPHGESMLSNLSQVDLDNIDLKEFPKVKDLDFTDCILEEGDMIDVPAKWWHYVRSLFTSFSVSFWWSATDPSKDLHSLLILFHSIFLTCFGQLMIEIQNLGVPTV